MSGVETDFVPPAAEITAEYDDGAEIEVAMHDGSVVRFTKVPDGYDPRVVVISDEGDGSVDLPAGDPGLGRYGSALGGTRFWNYASTDDAITDALRLARGMSY
ncbi:MAG: hypothetical protein ABL989_12015, partial [Gammaproteobacteria bacterium]